MAGRSCYSCIYACCDPGVWLRCSYAGLPLLPRCANHPSLPGRMQDVTGTPCRNYRSKPAIPRGDVRLIPLTDGFYAYVDAADYEWLSRYTWCALDGYAARREKRKTIYMHREIMQPPKGMIVDHIDGSRANNCRFNLRVCTHAQNRRNSRKHRDSVSIFKGVSYRKQLRKWYSQCWFVGKDRKGAYVDDEVEAARAYDRTAVECFGEFARLNFPEEWPPERRRQVYADYQAGREGDGGG